MPFMKKTYTQKPAEVSREWYLVDASEASLGRIAVIIADKLVGKSKVTFTPHVDGGDYVVVINAKSAVVTGGKDLSKVYHHHSGYQGGLRSLRLEEVREMQPERIIIDAVKGMMPRNKLAEDRLARLRVFPGAEHAHEAQTPKKVEVK